MQRSKKKHQNFEKLEISAIAYNFKNWSFQKFPANLESMHFSCKILRAEKQNLQGQEQFLTQIQGQKFQVIWYLLGAGAEIAKIKNE